MNGRSADDHFALIRAARIGRTAASGAATQGVASGNAECERRGPQAEVTTRAFPSNLTGVVLDPPGCCCFLLLTFKQFLRRAAGVFSYVLSVFKPPVSYFVISL